MYATGAAVNSHYNASLLVEISLEFHLKQVRPTVITDEEGEDRQIRLRHRKEHLFVSTSNVPRKSHLSPEKDRRADDTKKCE
jgi:hypothetical protein